MNLYLDTEFNGFGGSLISLAIYDPNPPAGHHFYEVCELPEKIDPWVAEHVIPKLGKAPIGRKAFTEALRSYLRSKPENPTIIADWPNDLALFFDALMVEGHWNVDIPVTARLLESGQLWPKLPHNAFSDAHALAIWHTGVELRSALEVA